MDFRDFIMSYLGIFCLMAIIGLAVTVSKAFDEKGDGLCISLTVDGKATKHCLKIGK